MRGKSIILPVFVALLLSASTMVAAASYLTTLNQPPAARGLGASDVVMGGGFDIGWHNPIGGLGEMSSDTYRLHSTAGQPVIGDFSGASYNVHMGFWQEAITGIRRLFLPFVLK